MLPLIFNDILQLNLYILWLCQEKLDWLENQYSIAIMQNCKNFIFNEFHKDFHNENVTSLHHVNEILIFYIT